MEPLTTVALINAGSNVLGSALKGGGGGGPSRADSAGYAHLDSSAWSVTFGDGSPAQASASPGTPWLVLAGLAIAAVVAIKVFRKS